MQWGFSIMLGSDRIYSAYRDYLRAIKELRDQGLSKFIESRRYRKIRQTYLEYIATFRDPQLDKRVNDLLEGADNTKQKPKRKM